MPLPSHWVDQLFGRLTLRYGAAFLRQWPDVDIDALKADWADVLDNMPPDAIAYALRYLPPAPMNALQFRDMCRRSPPAPAPRLEAPVASPAQAAAALKAAMAAVAPTADANMSHAERCIRNIERIASARGYMSGAQRMQVEACRRVLGWDRTPEVGA